RTSRNRTSNTSGPADQGRDRETARGAASLPQSAAPRLPHTEVCPIMTHPTNTGHGRRPDDPTAAQFDREFLLLADLAESGGNPELARLDSDLKDAEYERREAEQR